MTHNLAPLDAWQDEFTQLRHHLHEHPELGLDTLDYSPRYLGHEIASGRSESNVWSVANTD